MEPITLKDFHKLCIDELLEYDTKFFVNDKCIIDLGVNTILSKDGKIRKELVFFTHDTITKQRQEVKKNEF